MIDRFKDTAQFYVKLDLALLAGLGTVFTILKLDPAQIAESIHKLEPEIVRVLALLSFALLLERCVVLFAESIVANKIYVGLVKALFLIQTFAHIFIFTGLVSYMLGYSAGVVEVRAQETVFESARALVTTYIEKHNRLPISIVEIESDSKAYPNISFAYKYVDSSNYQIVLPGPDNILGTSDDWTRPVNVVFKTDTVRVKRK
jgi:hypothetical protein